MPSQEQLRQSINQRLKTDSVWRAHAIGALNILDGDPFLTVNVDDGEAHSMPFTELFCQAYRADTITFEDRILTALAWQDVLNGKLIYRFIQISEPPHPDKDTKGNQAILDDMVQHYTARELYGIEGAEFWGGTQGADGYIKFSEPFIGLFGGFPTHPISESPRRFIQAKRAHFPLEVGFCLPHQMNFHLASSRCVARLPYGWDFIAFLEAVDC